MLRWYATDDLSNTDEMRPYVEPAKRLVLDWAAELLSKQVVRVKVVRSQLNSKNFTQFIAVLEQAYISSKFE